MLVSDLIYKIRKISGFQNQDTVINGGVSISNDNLVLEAINNAQKQLANDQFRPFIQTVSLSSHYTLGNDQYMFLDNYGWDSKVTNSTAIASAYIKIPTREMQTRPLYFYNQGGDFSLRGYSYAGKNVYYPSEFASLNGRLEIIGTHTITPYANIHIPYENINTFKMSFNVYSENNRDKAIYKFDTSLSTVPYIFKKVNQDLTIIIDFDNMKLSYLHTGKTSNVYVVEFLSYPWGNGGSTLLYNGRVRRMNAKTEYTDSRDMQMYVIPYSVIDPSQHISEIISGSADLLEYFIYECIYQLQLSLRDIDRGVFDIRMQKRAEYISANSMKTYENHAFFPSS